MKRLIQETTLRVLPSLIVSLFVLWWFQPTIFNTGIHKINWIIIIKITGTILAVWWFFYSIILTNEQRKMREKTSYLKNTINNLSPFEAGLLLDIYNTNEKYIIRDFDTGNRQYHCYKSFAIEGLTTIEKLMESSAEHLYDTVKIILNKETIEILGKAKIIKVDQPSRL